MSLTSAVLLSAHGCDNTLRRASKSETHLLRRQNVERAAYTKQVRALDTEARQRDKMQRNWDYYRQMLTTTQDKYCQYNAMWGARDDLYRQRREQLHQARISKYEEKNLRKASNTENFLERSERVLRYLPDEQNELLQRKLTMSILSKNNEIELYRNRNLNGPMCADYDVRVTKPRVVSL